MLTGQPYIYSWSQRSRKLNCSQVTTVWIPFCFASHLTQLWYFASRLTQLRAQETYWLDPTMFITACQIFFYEKHFWLKFKEYQPDFPERLYGPFLWQHHKHRPMPYVTLHVIERLPLLNSRSILTGINAISARITFKRNPVTSACLYVAEMLTNLVSNAAQSKWFRFSSVRSLLLSDLYKNYRCTYTPKILYFLPFTQPFCYKFSFDCSIYPKLVVLNC